jgi:hypothetical protein
MDEEESLWIESTSDPDGEPVCLLTWGPLQWPAPADKVRAAAADLMACAAYAEMAVEMAGTLKLDGPLVSRVLAAVINGTGRAKFGNDETVVLLPGGSTKTATPYVLLRRGSRRGDLTAREARSMALQWLEVAEGTESDQLVAEALRSAGMDREARERVFGYMKELCRRRESRQR